MPRSFGALLALSFICVGGGWSPAAADAGPRLFITPDPSGHPDAVRAIQSARRSVDMTMFHLTDARVIDALLAARGQGVRVRVMLDGRSLSTAKFRDAERRLSAGGVAVRGSSPAFSITHQKSLTIDSERALIMSMNMTREADRTRDYGIETADPGIVAEIERVFEADWVNSETGQGQTPGLTNPDLAWSPVDSEEKLVGLVDSSTGAIVATVENLGDEAVQNAFLRAVKRGVVVRLIVPMCDINKDPLYNYRFLGILTRGGAQARVMPYPATPEHPYMHAKMMVVDGGRGYVGSINYSVNSMRRARELGLLISNGAVLAQIIRTFESDWAKSSAVPLPPPDFCPVPQDG